MYVLPTFKKSPHNSLCNSLVPPSSLHGLANVASRVPGLEGAPGSGTGWGVLALGLERGVLAPGEGTAGSGTREGVLALGPDGRAGSGTRWGFCLRD